ncbi:hypothetical protein [Pseudarthrobacter sp. PS3-L1]|uniref:hypothetical protein n=1 Tax=Pseudarthrobacter sp. PS3-L1 TaxID=3046207 RepID=UPI0024BA6347|nr:hypothetical protein [Pseudarthrobacter sp. PS3-L1]MDJ0321814.1 hypothetical protein [Pseudarthrobacter sp. PS3-L1]
MRFDYDPTFLQDGKTYEHENPALVHAVGSVTHFYHRQYPTVIVQMPLTDGTTVDVHAHAAGYTEEWVHIQWHDDRAKYSHCWVPVGAVRRAAAPEWRGSFLH